VGGHVVRMGEGRIVYRVLVGKSVGKSPVGRSRRRGRMGSKFTLRRFAGGCVEWRAVVNAMIRLLVLAPRS
jgi:hypothetical protein